MKVGFIGTGNIAVKMADTINAMDGVTCYAAASRSQERADRFKEKYGFTKAYGSYEEMVDDEDVDLVYVATPHSRHYEDARLCIEHGKPALVEKSFTANAKQAESLIRLAEEKKVLLAEAIWTRYMPSRRLISDAIAAGKIGDIVTLTANLGYDIKDVKRMTEPALAGGALLDVGIYPLQFASMFLGEDVTEIVSACTKTATGVDKTNAMILKYRGGQMSILHSSMMETTEQYGVIHGTKGYLIAKNLNNVDAIEIYNADRELVEEITVPDQISGYEYEMLACRKALNEGRIECEEAPHNVTLALMKQMDTLRAQWGIRYPFEE